MQDHALQVEHCVNELPHFFQQLAADFNQAQTLTQKISDFEHEADKIKNAIRNNLGKSILLPIKKNDLLDILSIQDAIADTAQDIAVLCTLKPQFKLPVELRSHLEILLEKAMATFHKYKQIINLMDELLEATFSGPQAENIKDEIHEVALMEHETDKAQKLFLQKVFLIEDSLSKSDFFILAQLSKEIGDIANISERAANKIRLILLG